MKSTPGTCAVCKKTLEPDAAGTSPLFPFCSVRCKQVDLLRWCNGDYAITDRLTPDRLQNLDPEQLAELGLDPID